MGILNFNYTYMAYISAVKTIPNSAPERCLYMGHIRRDKVCPNKAEIRHPCMVNLSTARVIPDRAIRTGLEYPTYRKQ